MDLFRNFFAGRKNNEEILFFILVFLILFNGNLFGIFGNTNYNDECCEGGNSELLFFIILFLLLFCNGNFLGGECEPTC